MRCLDRLFVLAILAVGTAAGGCLQHPARRRDDRLVASTSPFHADVPVPVGFELDEQSSERWPDKSARFVRHCYGGRADKSSVRRFYEVQMPLMRWSCDRDATRDGVNMMYFRRGSESCTVRIATDAAVGWRTTVEVTISPIRDNDS